MTSNIRYLAPTGKIAKYQYIHFQTRVIFNNCSFKEFISRNICNINSESNTYAWLSTTRAKIHADTGQAENADQDIILE